MSDSEFLAKRNEYCRQMLQQIKDAPANETEEAFREHHLVGMSDPKLWGENLPAMVGYAFQMFEAGWKAKEAAQPAEEVQPVGEVFDEFVGLGIRTAVARWYVAGPKAGTPLYTRPPAADADRLDAERYRKATTTGIIVLHDGAKACVGKPEADAALDAIDAALAASKEKP